MGGARSARQTIAVPGLVILLGLGWLLTSVGVAPTVNWLWVLALGGTGILLLVVAGIDRVTIIVAPLLIITSLMSVLRQTGRLPFETEVPALVIVLGVLMLISRLANLPEPPARPSGPSSDGEVDER